MGARVVVTISCLVLGLGVWFFGGYRGDSRGAALQPPAKSGSIEASFIGYPSLRSLVAGSTVVVRGRVAGVERQYDDLIPLDNGGGPYKGATPTLNAIGQTKVAESSRAAQLPQAAPAAEERIPVTETGFAIEQVLAGSSVRAGDRITVTQIGSARTQLDDSPVLQTGEESILFLYHGNDGLYGFVGGPQGRFPIGADGLLHPLLPSSPIGRVFDNAKPSALVGAVHSVGSGAR